jgi:hypothetical protein
MDRDVGSDPALITIEAEAGAFAAGLGCEAQARRHW